MLSYITSFIWSSAAEAPASAGLDDYVRSKNVSYFSYGAEKSKLENALLTEFVRVMCQYRSVNEQIAGRSPQTTEDIRVAELPKLKLNPDEMIHYLDSVYKYASERLQHQLSSRESEMLRDRLRRVVDAAAPNIDASYNTISVKPVSDLQRQLNDHFGVQTVEIKRDPLRLIDDFQNRKQIIEETLRFKSG